MNDSSGFDTALRESFSRSQRHLNYEIESQRDMIRNLYSGRDPNYNAPPAWWSAATGETQITSLRGVVPATNANLLYSSIQSLVAALMPAVPSLRCEPLSDRAIELAEDQTDFLEWVFANSNADRAIQRAIGLALFDRWSAVKRVVDKSKKKFERTTFQAVDPSACGWEPFDHRYEWSRLTRQFSSLPQSWDLDTIEGVADIHPWDKILITEIYSKDFGGEKDKMFVYGKRVTAGGTAAKRTDDTSLENDPGMLIATEDIPCSPLAFLKFAQPAPQEDVPNGEVVQWMPILQVMTVVLQKIEREARQANHINLYDAGSVDLEKAIEKTINGVNELFIPVKGGGFLNSAGDVDTGVSHKLRPVERISIMGDLMQAFLLLKQEFNEISGLSDTRRGAFPGEVHAATTTAAVEQGADLRNVPRRESIAEAISTLGKIVMADQNEVYGDSIVIPEKGLPKEISVPNTADAQFSLRVDVVELGHLARRGDPQAAGTYLQTALQVESQGSVGPLTSDAFKYFLRTLGLKAQAKGVPMPSTDQNPLWKLANWKLGRGTLDARPGENHAAFMAFYDMMLAEEVSKNGSGDDLLIQDLTLARRQHQQLANAARPPRASRSAASIGGQNMDAQALGGLGAVIPQ